MRIHRTFVTAAAVLAAAAFAGAAQAASAQQLLRQHQPVLVFHPQEEFRPTTVESFVRDSDLEAATSPTEWALVDAAPTVGTLPAASPPIWRLNQRDCFAGAPLGDLACYTAAAADEPDPVVYGRVARDGGRTVLQYWLFYYDNVYRYPFLPLGAIWQSHEGDWEVVNVVLGPGRKPVAVGISRHCSGETRPWPDTPRMGRHPVVHVALGSHANYFEPGVHEFDRACLPPEVIGFFAQAGLPLPADVAASGPSEGIGRTGAPYAVRRISDGSPSWVAFPGFWGELEYFNAPPPIGTVPFGTGPRGPGFHEVWDAPLATLVEWS